jgi:SAM-dependent methyltransferase
MTGDVSQQTTACAVPDAAQGVHEVVLEILGQEKPGRLLDAPAGEGALAARVLERGHEVWCADIEPGRFRVKGLECRKMDMNQPWPFEAGGFDSVVSVEAVEHLENPWHLVREASRVLRPGGTFIVTTPNILNLRSRLSNLLYGYPNYFHYMVEQRPGMKNELPVDHINPIGFLELRHILARTGFSVEQVHTNRLVKHRSFGYKFLKRLLEMRGKTYARTDPAKALVRERLLSDPLLFGEILVVKSIKTAGL